ncbi:PP2C family protein-serine/threonine phosphatase [Phaeacidiphilus oryzae]|uniref:PP2C family protein-serine/threonine phosphatase n=1 Tax=Phaeacidiphilus oryzae TaxID=348818 RepID=UPI00055D1C60|nr:PP2C family protein-serine/threonine phosphatase [Phaeacidiphilus oryzae]
MRGRRRVVALLGPALAWMVLITLVDVLAPPDVHLGPLLAAAPAFVAGFAGVRATAVIAALAVTALVVIGFVRGALGTENLIVQLASLVLLGVLLTALAMLRERLRQRNERVSRAYATTRQTLLPPVPDRAGPLRLASCYHAAAGEADLGGDLFSLVRTETSTRIMIGDVRGKGMAALDALILLVGSFRAAAHRKMPLPELVAELEESVRWGLNQQNALYRGATGMGKPLQAEEHFVTAAVLDIPDERDEIELISCGHPAPLLIGDRGASWLRVERPAVPLGLGELARCAYASTVFPFPRDSVLLLYTDGASEARDREGRFFPLAECAARCARDSTSPRPEGSARREPEVLLRRLWAELVRHGGGVPADDTVLICADRYPTG